MENIHVFLYYLLPAHFVKDYLLVAAQLPSILLKAIFSKVLFVFLVVMFVFRLKKNALWKKAESLCWKKEDVLAVP